MGRGQIGDVPGSSREILMVEAINAGGVTPDAASLVTGNAGLKKQVSSSVIIHGVYHPFGQFGHGGCPTNANKSARGRAQLRCGSQGSNDNPIAKWPMTNLLLHRIYRHRDPA